MAYDTLRNTGLVRALSDVLADLSDLVQKEIRLAKAEVTEKISAKLQASVWMVAAAVEGLIAALLVIQGIVFAIASFGLALHWSCLLVAAALRAVGISVRRRLHTDLTRGEQTQSSTRSGSQREAPVGKIPGDDLALRIDAGAEQIQLRRTLRLPGMFVIAHPLYAYRFAYGARKQSGIFGDIVGAHTAVAPGGFPPKHTHVFFR